MEADVMPPVVWSDRITMILNSHLDSLRTDVDHNDSNRRIRDVLRLKRWLNDRDGTVFIVDHRNTDWGPDTIVLQLIDNRIVLTRGYHLQPSTALRAVESLDQDVINNFQSTITAYTEGFITALIVEHNKGVHNAKSNDQE